MGRSAERRGLYPPNLEKLERRLSPFALDAARRALSFQELDPDRLFAAVAEITKGTPEQVENIIRVRGEIINNLSLNFNPREQLAVIFAHDFALVAHGDQKRVDGSVFFTHPQWGLGEFSGLRFRRDRSGFLGVPILASTVLHDVDEDTQVQINDIRILFGSSVEGDVAGLNAIHGSDTAMSDARTAEKLIRGIQRNPRVLFIKLGADRRHNLRTPKDEAYLLRNALFTLDVLIPALYELGATPLVDELTEICLRATNPEFLEEYERVRDWHRESEEEAIKDIFGRLQSEKSEFDSGSYPGIEFSFPALYEIHKKTQGKVNLIEQNMLPRVILIYSGKQNLHDAVLGAHKFVNLGYVPSEGHEQELIFFGPKNSIVHLVDPRGKNANELWVTIPEFLDDKDGLLYQACGHNPSVETMRKIAPRMDRIGDLFRTIAYDYRHPVERVVAFSQEVGEPNIAAYTPKGDEKKLPAYASILDFAASVYSKMIFTVVGARVGRRIYKITDPVPVGVPIELIIDETQKVDLRRLLILTTREGRDQAHRLVSKILRDVNDPLRIVLREQMSDLFWEFLESGVGDLVEDKKLPFIPNHNILGLALFESGWLPNIGSSTEDRKRYAKRRDQLIETVALLRMNTQDRVRLLGDVTEKTVNYFRSGLITVPIINDRSGIDASISEVIAKYRINKGDARIMGSEAEGNYSVMVLCPKVPRRVKLEDVARDIQAISELHGFIGTVKIGLGGSESAQS